VRCLGIDLRLREGWEWDFEEGKERVNYKKGLCM
jgi:hypothetical protein